MNTEQIHREIRDASDRMDSLETAIDTAMAHLSELRERDIPASTASISHTLNGVHQIVADLAGTVHSLGSQLYSISDRINLLERVIDADVPPRLDPL